MSLFHIQVVNILSNVVVLALSDRPRNYFSYTAVNFSIISVICGIYFISSFTNFNMFIHYAWFICHTLFYKVRRLPKQLRLILNIKALSRNVRLSAFIFVCFNRRRRLNVSELLFHCSTLLPVLQPFIGKVHSPILVVGKLVVVHSRFIVCSERIYVRTGSKSIVKEQV